MQTIVNLGTGGADLNGQNGSTTSADSNDALFLDWPGDNAGNYVYLPGVAGNYLSVPDDAALDITGDIDIRVRVALDDWTPGSDQVLLSKFTGGGGQSFLLWIQGASTGTVQWIWSANGTSNTTISSTLPNGVTDGSVKWIRVTHDVDNGASGNDVRFFTSDDGATWVQLGTTITTAGIASFHVSTTPVEIGTRNGGVLSANAAKIYGAQVLDGIDGTKVLDVDTSVITSGSATSFTDLTGNHTVTINRSTSGRKSVAVVSPVWLFGTDDYMEVADNELMDFTQAEDFTLITVVRAWGTAAALETTATKKQSTSAAAPGYLLGINTSNVTTSRIADGTNQSVVTTGSYSSGVVSVIGVIRDATAGTMQNFTNNTFAAASSVTMTATSENDRPFNVGRLAGNANYFNGEVLAVALYRRKLSASEIASVVSYYQNKAA